MQVRGLRHVVEVARQLQKKDLLLLGLRFYCGLLRFQRFQLLLESAGFLGSQLCGPLRRTSKAGDAVALCCGLLQRFAVNSCVNV